MLPQFLRGSIRLIRTNPIEFRNMFLERTIFISIR
jgi:hypothetical protein